MIHCGLDSWIFRAYRLKSWKHRAWRENKIWQQDTLWTTSKSLTYVSALRSKNPGFTESSCLLGDSRALDASSGTYHPHGSPGFCSGSTANLLLELPGAKSLGYLGVSPLLQFTSALPGAARSNMDLCFVNGSAAYELVPSLIWSHPHETRYVSD